MRGPALGEGFLPGVGLVRIFQDMDDTKRLFVQPLKRDTGERYVPRSRVQWRKRYTITKEP